MLHSIHLICLEASLEVSILLMMTWMTFPFPMHGEAERRIADGLSRTISCSSWTVLSKTYTRARSAQ